jgi:enterochelin esterase-like enzyme
MEIQYYELPSLVFDHVRRFTVLLPPSYSHSRRRYPTLYLHDGSEDWLEKGRLLSTLRRNSAEAGFPEFVVVLPEPEERTREYKLNRNHLRYIVEELVPCIDTQFRTLRRPDRRIVHGVSLGGLVSVWLGLKHPELFGAAGGQGGAYWCNQRRIIREVRRMEPVQTRFFLSCGELDGNLSDNRALAQALRSKSIECHYEEVRGQHSWACWARNFATALHYYFNHSSP